VNPLNRLSVYRSLRPQNSRSRSSIDAFRDRKLRKVVRHAASSVPYYEKLFASHGVDAEEVNGVADLIRIPITSRSQIQSTSIEDRLAKGVDQDKLIVRQTTGSSGQCLFVMRTWTEEQVLNLMRWRALRAYGLKLSDVIAVPRVPIGRHRRDYPLPRRIADAIGFYRKDLLDLTTVDDASRILIEREPEVVMGWPTILADLAPRWNALRTAKTKPPKFIISGGEMLSGHARAQISEGFEAKVYDMMGAHEFSLLASECPVTGEYHMSDETIYAEVIVDGRRAEPGEEGELVVTGLHSMAMPFVRYNLGDIVIQGSEQCGCGSPFSTIRSIKGRTGEYFNLPEGRRVHPQDIVRMSFIAAKWIRQLQVVQINPAYLELYVVPVRPPSDDEIRVIKEAIRKVLWNVATLEVVVVPEIPTTYDTKFRIHRSLVDQEQ
jgi:phenylacetate-CoA ligase